MIDIQNETMLSLGDACKALPRIDGKRPHHSTLWRWCRKGVRGVHLEYVRFGHRICTSVEALTRFTQELASIDPTPNPIMIDALEFKDTGSSTTAPKEAERTLPSPQNQQV